MNHNQSSSDGRLALTWMSSGSLLSAMPADPYGRSPFQVLIIVIILGFYGIANASPTGTLTYVGRLGSDLTRLPKLRPKNLVTD